MTEKNPAAVALGRLGGLKKTPARAAASRMNGAMGGRPRGDGEPPRPRVKRDPLAPRVRRSRPPAPPQPPFVQKYVRDTEGHWFNLMPGWKDQATGRHYINGATRREAYNNLERVVTCDCVGCQALGGDQL